MTKVFQLATALLISGWVFSSLRAADWSIDIVPTSSGGKDSIQVINLYHPIYVVLTNTSGHDLTVWKEGCSWGYFNLSFKFTDKNGQVVVVSKKETAFTRNFPRPFIVTPGHNFILPVLFLHSERPNDSDWENTNYLQGQMLVKAVYKNTNEAFPGDKVQRKESDDWNNLIKSAWLGQIESNPVTVTIQR